MDKEQQNALNKYGNFHSTHEVYGVLMEEVQEFFDIVKEPTKEEGFDYAFDALKFKKERMIKELDQIRAVAERAMNELKESKIKWVW